MDNNKEMQYWLACNRALASKSKIVMAAWELSGKRLAPLFQASLATFIHMGFTAADWERLRACSLEDVKLDLKWEEKSEDHHIIRYIDEAYPPLLREIANPPLLLYIKGQPQVLSAVQLAMVGTRRPTVGGQALATQFSRALVEVGFVITSGLALGIDGLAHQAALSADGITIGVVGSGLENLYPTRHRSLAAKIAEQGALVSEFSPHTPALKEHFPRRNRIISGLSSGVLVVEAALRSGSLITARHAMEQNRDVFAIPGSVNNIMVQGCHALLKQGAKLVDCLDDILEELSVEVKQQNKNKAGNIVKSCSNLSSEEQILIQAIGFDVTSIDELVARSGLNVQTVTSRLVDLQFIGLVQSTPGGYIRAWGAQHERECA